MRKLVDSASASVALPCDRAVPDLPVGSAQGSRFNSVRPVSPGLTSDPRAFSVSRPLRATRFARLRAAFSSRSITIPHPTHWKVRSANPSLAFTREQAEQVLVEANHRSATWRCCRTIWSCRSTFRGSDQTTHLRCCEPDAGSATSPPRSIVRRPPCHDYGQGDSSIYARRRNEYWRCGREFGQPGGGSLHGPCCPPCVG